MDPASLVLSVSAIIRPTITIAVELKQFISDTKNINEHVRGLLVEVLALETALKAVKNGLQDPAVHQAEKHAGKADSHELWQSVNGSLINTRMTVDKLDESLEDVRANRQGFAKQALRQLRLNLKEGEIQELRSQCRTHVGCLNVTLQMITVRAVCLAPGQVTAQLGDKIEGLRRMIVGLKEQIQTSQDDSSSQDITLVAYSERAKHLQASAQRVLSSASTTYSRSEFGGSIAGDGFDDTKREQTMRWITEPRIVEAHFETKSDDGSESASRAVSDERDTAASGTEETDLSFAARFDTDTGSEFEFELAEKSLSEGLSYFDKGDYTEAEGFITLCHEQAALLSHDQQERLDLHSSRLKLAECAFRTGDNANAEKQLHTFIKHSMPSNDAHARAMCDASHLLALIYLASGRLVDARSSCRKALVGRQRLLGKAHYDYHESLFLLTQICISDGNRDREAKLLLDMISVDSLEKLQRTYMQREDLARAIALPKSRQAIDDGLFQEESTAARELKAPPAKLELNRSASSSQIEWPDSNPFRSNNPFRRAVTVARHNTTQALPDRKRDDSLTRSKSVPNSQSMRDRSPPPSLPRIREPDNEEAGSSVAVRPLVQIMPSISLATSQTRVDWTLLAQLANTLLEPEQYPVPLWRENRCVSEKQLQFAHIQTIDTVISMIGRDPTMLTPLHTAVAVNHMQLVGRMLQEKYQVDTKSRQPKTYGMNSTPLHIAAEYGRVEMTRTLMSAGADPLCTTDVGQTPLHVAAANGRHKVIDALLHRVRGIHVNAQDRFLDTPLHFAAASGSKDSIVSLASAGGDVDAVNSRKQMPIHVAAARGRDRALQALVDEGANIESVEGMQGSTALLIAAETDFAAAVAVLVDASADTTAEDHHGRTAEDWANHHHNHSILEKLAGSPLKKRKPVHSTGASFSDDSPVTSTNRRRLEDEDSLKVVVTTPDDSKIVPEPNSIQNTPIISPDTPVWPNNSVEENWSPLHHAAYVGDRVLVKKLVSEGASPSGFDSLGRTPRALAHVRGHVGIEAYLEGIEQVEFRTPRKSGLSRLLSRKVSKSKPAND